MNNRLISGPTQAGGQQPLVAAASDAVKPRRIYIDCTETYLSGLNTGIQRVARNIGGRAKMLSDHLGIPCQAVIARDGFAVPVDMSLTIDPRYLRTRRLIDKGRALWDGWLNPWLSHVRPVARRLGWAISHSLFGKNEGRSEPPILLCPSDLVILVDSFWVTGRSEALIRSAKASGAKVVVVVFDITPITHPQFWESGAKEFRERLLRVLAVVDGVITISRDVQTQLAEFLAVNGAPVPPMDYAYLGADFSPVPIRLQEVRKSLTEVCGGGQVYVMVGTFEPRKRHLTVLEAFEHLWAAGHRSKLVMVGRLGWQCDEIELALKLSQYRDKQLFVYHDASDMELEYLYARSRGLIFASVAEGFGLPLVEAMSRGVPVIASDIPVFREIGQDYPVYFPVGDSMALAEAVRITDERPRLAAREWVGWGTAAQDYLDRAIKIFGDVA